MSAPESLTRKRGRTPALTLRDKFELRQLRESGVEVTEAAAYLGVSRATALRALAELREKLGPEKLPNGQRARSPLRRLDFQPTK